MQRLGVDGCARRWNRDTNSDTREDRQHDNRTQWIATLHQGAPEFFTGSVRVEPLFETLEPSRVTGGLVTFEPGARSNWHTHPLGQTLIVVSGKGWTQCWAEAKQEIGPGDVIWCPPGHKHWHGAAATTAMSHIAIQEHKGDGKVVEWPEPVSDAQFSS